MTEVLSTAPLTFEDNSPPLPGEVVADQMNLTADLAWQEALPASPQEQNKPLTTEQQAIQTQREQWAERNPGKSYLTPEGPTIGPEDIARLEAEAENYGFDVVDRQSVLESYNMIAKAGAQRQTELREKYAAEEYNTDVIEKLIKDKTEEAADAAREAIISSALPYPEQAKRRDRRKIDNQRDKLAAMLSKSPEDFQALQADWAAYEDIQYTRELGRLHGEALKDDGSLKAAEERGRLKIELKEIEDRNGGAAEYLSRLPLADDPRTAEIIKGYSEQTGRHQNDEDLLDADRLQAFHNIKLRLGELTAEQSVGWSDEQIKTLGDEAGPYIEKWLASIPDNENDPLADLKTYKNKEMAYNTWHKRRRQAAEYLAPMLMMRSVKKRLHAVVENAAELPVEGGRALKIILDPHRIGEKNGARALRHTDELSQYDARIYQAGVMGQLEMARTYGRHQGNIMKAALLLNAVALGSYNNLSDGWDRLSESEKKKELKKKMYGKAALGSIFARRIAAQAAKKAKTSIFQQAAAKKES